MRLRTRLRVRSRTLPPNKGDASASASKAEVPAGSSGRRVPALLSRERPVRWWSVPLSARLAIPPWSMRDRTTTATAAAAGHVPARTDFHQRPVPPADGPDAAEAIAAEMPRWLHRHTSELSAAEGRLSAMPSGLERNAWQLPPAGHEAGTSSGAAAAAEMR